LASEVLLLIFVMIANSHSSVGWAIELRVIAPTAAKTKMTKMRTTPLGCTFPGSP
jgi:hypothetical protein